MGNWGCSAWQSSAPSAADLTEHVSAARTDLEERFAEMAAPPNLINPRCRSGHRGAGHRACQWNSSALASDPERLSSDPDGVMPRKPPSLKRNSKWVFGAPMARLVSNALSIVAVLAASMACGSPAPDPPRTALPSLAVATDQAVEVASVDGVWHQEVARGLCPDGRSEDLALSHDGRRLAITCAPERGVGSKLYLVQLSTGRVDQVGDSVKGAPGGLAWSPDGRWLAYLAVVHAGPAPVPALEVHAYETASGTSRTLDRARYFVRALSGLRIPHRWCMASARFTTPHYRLPAIAPCSTAAVVWPGHQAPLPWCLRQTVLFGLVSANPEGRVTPPKS